MFLQAPKLHPPSNSLSLADLSLCVSRTDFCLDLWPMMHKRLSSPRCPAWVLSDHGLQHTRASLIKQVQALPGEQLVLGSKDPSGSQSQPTGPRPAWS